MFIEKAEQGQSSVGATQIKRQSMPLLWSLVRLEFDTINMPALTGFVSIL